MLGHLSGAYTARVSQDLSLASRFDFNVYSVESQWTVGAEWWLRRRSNVYEDEDPLPNTVHRPDVNGVIKARVSTSNVRCGAFLFQTDLANSV